jgi:hypothetical protein
VNVHHPSVPYAIALAGVAADDLETPVGAILLGLLGGKPRLEEGDGFLLDPAASIPATTIMMTAALIAISATPTTTSPTTTQIIRLAAGE